MRGVWIIAAGLAVTLSPSAARAGVYFTTGTTVRDFAQPSDPDALELWPLPSPFQQFQSDLADYRTIAIKDSPRQKHYLRRIAELQAQQAKGLFSLDDRINLGAYYIRLGRYKDALDILRPAQNSSNFMLQANLAYAYEMTPAEQGGDRELAERCQQTVIDNWPTVYPGWTSQMLVFYRRAEQHYQKLLLLRHSEKAPARGRPQLELDKLFPRVHFLGANGKYQVGSINPKSEFEAPNDAILLVMQLHLWLPFDNRLSWLLGELLNASGDVGGATAMFNQVYNALESANVKEKDMPDDLVEHRRMVTQAAELRDKLNTDPKLQDPYRNLKLLCAFAPRGMGLGAGDLIQEASWQAIIIDDQEKQAAKTTKTASDSPAPTSAPTVVSTDTTWVPNWRQLAVGFGTGAIVALLLGMQFRQRGRPKG